MKEVAESGTPLESWTIWTWSIYAEDRRRQRDCSSVGSTLTANRSFSMPSSSQSSVQSLLLVLLPDEVVVT